jgi:hypothetical protein
VHRFDTTLLQASRRREKRVATTRSIARPRQHAEPGEQVNRRYIGVRFPASFLTHCQGGEVGASWQAVVPIEK